jgi:hypothetical protein
MSPMRLLDMKLREDVLMMRRIGILAIFISLPCWAGRSFNGSSDLITANGIGTSLDIIGPETISFWVYPTLVDSNAHAMVAHFATGNVSGSQFTIGLGVAAFSSTNQLAWEFGCCGAFGPSYGSCGTVTPNQWYQVVAWFDPAGKYAGSPASGMNVLPLGSSLLTCSTGAVGTTKSPGQANLTIGNGGTQNINGGVGFEGTIAEVAIWNDILSPEERVALTTVCPMSVRRTALAGYFPLWGASGSSIEPDLSGNTNNGVLTGTGAADHAPCAP